MDTSSIFDFSPWFDKFLKLFDDLFTFINDSISYILGYLLGLISAIFTRLFYFLYEFFDFVLNPFMTFLEDSYKKIGLQHVLDLYSSLQDSPISYFLSYFYVSDILLTVLSAYTLRFIIRRIPFIG